MTRKRRRTYTQAIDPCLGYYLHAGGDARVGAPETIPPPNYLGVRAGKWSERTRSAVPTSFDGERELEIPTSELARPGTIPGRRRYAAGSVMAENKPHVSEHASVLSVEEFLKRSSDSERHPTLNLRRYRGKRRAAGRLVIQSSSPEDPNKSHSRDSEEATMIRLRSRNIPRGDLADSEFETSSHLMTSSPVRESGKTVRPRKKPRKGKNLRERLHEAAVSTYGYVDPDFMDAAAARREESDILDPQIRVKPLRFVPGSGIQQRTRSLRHHQDRRTFVDPRKSNAIRTASFLSSSKDRTARIASNSESAVLMNALDRLPAEKWVLDLESEEETLSAGRNLRTHRHSLSTSKRKHSKDSLLTAPGRISECPPLAFVDFEQAEAAYANIFLVERWRVLLIDII